jgi:glycosyltransferase involved in cell wall biosynthesis
MLMELKNRLSIIVACYNEEQFIIPIIRRMTETVLIGNTEKEIIVIDDASTDLSFSLLEAYQLDQQNEPIRLYRQDRNRGKGACLRLGIEKASGTIIIIQDADLEYDPSDYNRLLKPILDGHADVVYGSRFRGSEPHRVMFFFHTIGNKFLTFLSNLFTQLNLTDMETGYKMFKAHVIKPISLKENRFGFEPEITAKISRIKGIRIYEVGISYFGRTFEEGKKINWKDGLWSMYCVLRYNLFRGK